MIILYQNTMAKSFGAWSASIAEEEIVAQNMLVAAKGATANTILILIHINRSFPGKTYCR